MQARLPLSNERGRISENERMGRIERVMEMIVLIFSLSKLLKSYSKSFLPK